MGDPAAPVTWATVADVAGFLGLPADDAQDAAYLAAVTAAANWWAWDRRRIAGYVDVDLAAAPNEGVKLGVTFLAGGWYRRRGAPDGFAGWVELGAPGVPSFGSGLADVNRLLGIGRPVVA